MTRRRSRFSALAIACAGVAWLGPALARADGALPASLGVLVPEDRPEEIVLATNFGLISSEDGGGSWSWSCEQQATNLGVLYGMSGPPRDRLFAISLSAGLALSDDGGCSWRRAGGALATAQATDYFVDANAPDHVVAAAISVIDGGFGPEALFQSTDGGTTFAEEPLFVADPDVTLTGVEIARADSNVIYLSGYEGTSATGYRPRLVRSADGGQTWATADLEPLLGEGLIYILGVDAANVDTVYLRVVQAGLEAIAVIRDRGASAATPLVVRGGTLSAFLERASGTILVGGLAPGANGEASGLAYRSTDAAQSFQSWALPGAPHLMGLAERNGTLYLAGDDRLDGWALATSANEGATLQPLTSYAAVTAIRPCAAATCEPACLGEAALQLWPSAVCGTGPDAGAPMGGSAGGSSSGCGCGLADHGPMGLTGALGLAVAAAVAAARSRWRRSSRSTSNPRV